jgi:hyperosmotically inducible protein
MSHLHTPARKLALAATLAAILSSTSGLSVAATATQQVEDARQQARIETTYALNPYIRASEIMVAVQGGKATLTGTVDEDVSKDLATQIEAFLAEVAETVDRLQAKYALREAA